MYLFLTLAVLLLPPQAAADSQPANPWKDFQFLMGDWIAEGGGAPGQGTGVFSFRPDLDGKILVRNNRADYPATSQRTAYSHRDLMVVYPGVSPRGFRAVYFDNEGHVIQYTANFPSEGKVEFLSDAVSGAPRFRLTYERISGGRLAVKFEIAPPDKPDQFTTYLEGTARRRKP